jgi:DUF2924 family protein
MSAVEDEISSLEHLPSHELKIAWRRLYRGEPPRCRSRDLMIRALAYRMQERAYGGLAPAAKRKLRGLVVEIESKGVQVFDPGIALKPGARPGREWCGRTHTVIVLEDGFEYNGERHPSLTKIAARITGAHWSGPRFFGIGKTRARRAAAADAADD